MPFALRRNSLGLTELVFQGVTHIAPATNIVFTFPIIAVKAGPVMPISFLLSMIICLFIGNTVAQFSRYVASSGGINVRHAGAGEPQRIHGDMELFDLRDFRRGWKHGLSGLSPVGHIEESVSGECAVVVNCIGGNWR